MIAPILLASFLLAGPAQAVDAACGAESYATASLLGDLNDAILQFIPFPSIRKPCEGACAARRSVKRQTDRHERLLKHRGVGVWYGDGSAYNLLDDAERQAWLAENTKNGWAPPRADDLKRSSCIEWVMEHVEAYYASIGDLETWQRIERTVRSEKLTGTSLARELQAAGWTSIYMNADGSYQGITRPDAEHAYSLSVVERDGTYYGTPVDESIVGWGNDPDKLRELEQEPFFVLVQRGGLHVTAGVDGQVNELARSQGPDSQVIYQDPLRDIIDIYADEIHDGGDEGRDGAMHMWGSGLALVPPKHGS